MWQCVQGIWRGRAAIPHPTPRKECEVKPEEQRIAIAEWCGWEWWTHPEGTPKLSKPRDDNERKYWISCGCVTCNGPGKVDSKIPDYLNDLNAMHEAENRLSPDQKDYFANAIINPTHGPHWRFNCVHSTAAQRAEALLRTIGKSTDSTLHTKG